MVSVKELLEHRRLLRGRMARVPRAEVARGVAYHWTSDLFQGVCEYKRSKKSYRGNVENYEGKVAAALDAYLRYSAPRVPTAPRDPYGRLDPTTLVLWRGVVNVPIPPVGATMTSNRGCFASFTRHKHVATRFLGNDGTTDDTLFRLRAADIARSTPWAWFADPLPEHLRTAKERNTVRSSLPYESEVLLPPGYFKVLHVEQPTMIAPRIVTVAFTPEPRYLLKAQIPPLDRSNGMPVVRTVGGGDHKFRDAALRDGVRARAAAVAAAAARVRAATNGVRTRAARAGARKRKR